MYIKILLLLKKHMYLLQEIFLNMYVFKIRINPQDGSPLSHHNLSYIVLATYGEIFIVALHVLKLKPYKGELAF